LSRKANITRKVASKGIVRRARGTANPPIMGDASLRREYPAMCRPIYDRAMTGRSRKAGIKSFCTMCMGYQPRLVKTCDVKGCPLYPYRSG
jgi:hypothetical protein